MVLGQNRPMHTPSCICITLLITIFWLYLKNIILLGKYEASVEVEPLSSLIEAL
ncbi:hypothetical protein Hanom_Chr12g01111501 [Helianthus anomalus]